MNKKTRHDTVGVYIIITILVILIIGAYITLQPAIRDAASTQDCLATWQNYTYTELDCQPITNSVVAISDYRCQTSEGIILFLNYPISVKNTCNGQQQ